MIFQTGQHDDPKQIHRHRIIFGVVMLCMVLAIGLTLWKHFDRTVPTVAEQEIQNTEPGTEQSAQSMTETGLDVASTQNGTVETVEGATSGAAVSENEVEAVEPTAEPHLSLMMVGDDLLHAPVSDSGKRADGSYNYNHLFKHIRSDIKEADLAMINEEVILAGEELGISGYPRFNGRTEIGDAISKAGFNMVLHATNHALDRGRDGVVRTLKYWRKQHPDMQVTGMYDSQKRQDQISYFEKDGITVAILNYTYGTNGIPLPANMSYAVNLLDKKRVKQDVAKAKKKADFIVVCPHWGTEYNIATDAMQQEWSQYFLKLGVGLVIGTHPHVVEPVKWVKDKSGHRMLVYYSLGNYINASSRIGSKVCQQYFGGMAKVELVRNESGDVEIDDASFVPLITHWPADGKITTYKVADYTRKLATENRLARQDRTFTYEYMKQFFKEEINKKILDMKSGEKLRE